MPDFWGGTRKAANSREPTHTTAPTSAMTFATGRPRRVKVPGSGSPRVSNTSPAVTEVIAAASTAASATPGSSSATTLRRGRRGRGPAGPSVGTAAGASVDTRRG
nr:hypothetical protein GCM10020241_24060 [Streptoalloteichus tenebrarius]